MRFPMAVRYAATSMARRRIAQRRTTTARAPVRQPAPRQRRRRSPEQRDERRAQLIAAARDVFAEKGYHEATVDDITRKAGVAKGTFYLYFDEKREIYHELVRTFLQHITDIGRSVAREVKTPKDFFARTEQATNELLRVFIDHFPLARLAYRESMGINPELDRMLRQFYRDLAKVEAENIRLGIELGLFRQVDPLVTAYAHIGMVERVALGLLTEKNPPEPKQVARELLSIAFEGLRKR
jgi:AcrR family transcriptional regulator